MRPCRSRTAATSCCHDDSSLTSARRCVTSPPSASPAGSTTSAVTTAAPWAARYRLSPAPMPRAPPVTTTTVPGATLPRMSGWLICTPGAAGPTGRRPAARTVLIAHRGPVRPGGMVDDPVDNPYGRDVGEERSMAAAARDAAEQVLRTAISRGDLPPGHRLVEAELAGQIGVNRSSVRLAIDVLIAD